MLFGKNRIQRITVGIIVGLVVLSLALTLVGGALAAPGPVPSGAGAFPPVSEETTTPPVAGIVRTDNPKPVTETPQGTSTQVTDAEHIGGLVAYLVFMLAGVLLLLRGKRRDWRERAEETGSESILSRP
ncbi:MAG TPA: hypothetical protein VFY98_01045 [Intrasporangium sp.]|nr:hypothetical protein [Intrasporangium sp.]